MAVCVGTREPTRPQDAPRCAHGSPRGREVESLEICCPDTLPFVREDVEEMCPRSSSWGTTQPPREWGVQRKELNTKATAVSVRMSGESDILTRSFSLCPCSSPFLTLREAGFGRVAGAGGIYQCAQ